VFYGRMVVLAVERNHRDLWWLIFSGKCVFGALYLKLWV
jgi:hypothetical protein